MKALGFGAVEARVAKQPSVAMVILGAMKLAQLEDNLAALDFSIPLELRKRLDMVSDTPAPFPHSYFGPQIQARVTGGAVTGAITFQS